MTNKKECVFCKLAKENKDKFVYESDNFFAVPDISPVTQGHTLIIPKKHYENIIDLPSVLASELLLAIKKIAEKKLKQGNHGFNMIINTGRTAGQVVNHFHAHIIPRKQDDGVRFFTKLKKNK